MRSTLTLKVLLLTEMDIMKDEANVAAHKNDISNKWNTMSDSLKEKIIQGIKEIEAKQAIPLTEVVGKLRAKYKLNSEKEEMEH